MPQPFKLKTTDPMERDIQAAVLKYLAVDRRVGWRHRFNTGAKRFKGTDARGRPTQRFVRFAFVGCSDILGQLIDGRFLAVECKRKGEEPSSEQADFLARVERFGGVAIVARSVDDVKAALDLAMPSVPTGDPSPLMHIPCTDMSRQPDIKTRLTAHQAKP